MNIVYNHIANILQRYTSVAGDVNFRSTAVDCFVTVNDEFVFQFYEHIAGEDDPEWFFLDYGVPECSRSWIYGVEIGGIGNDVVFAVFTSDCVLAEADCAIG